MLNNDHSHPKEKKKLAPKEIFRKVVRQLCFMQRMTGNDENLNKYSTLKMALQRSSIYRKKSDQMAIERFMSKLPFFQDLKQKQGFTVFSNFCSALSFRTSNYDQKIIRKDQHGEYFYVLLRGVVKVVIYKPLNEDAQIQLQIFQRMSNRGKVYHVDYDNEELFEKMTIATLKDGSTFGDLSLIQSNQLATASIITVSKCDFAIMDKESFWKYSGKTKQSDYDRKLNCIRSIPFLSHWSDTDLKTISFEFQPRSYTKGQLIYQEGQKNIGMYLIVQGETTLTAGYQNYQQEGGTELLHKINSDKRLPVSVLGNNYFFGNEPDSTYQLTAVCTSITLELYFISKHQIEKRLQWNAVSKEIYLQYQTIARDWREDRKTNLIKSLQQEQQKIDNELVAQKFLSVNQSEKLIKFTKVDQNQLNNQITSVKFTPTHSRKDTIVLASDYEKSAIEAQSSLKYYKKVFQITKGTDNFEILKKIDRNENSDVNHNHSIRSKNVESLDPIGGSLQEFFLTKNLRAKTRRAKISAVINDLPLEQKLLRTSFPNLKKTLNIISNRKQQFSQESMPDLHKQGIKINSSQQVRSVNYNEVINSPLNHKQSFRTNLFNTSQILSKVKTDQNNITSEFTLSLPEMAKHNLNLKQENLLCIRQSKNFRVLVRQKASTTVSLYSNLNPTVRTNLNQINDPLSQNKQSQLISQPSKNNLDKVH